MTESPLINVEVRRVLAAHKEPHLTLGIMRWWLSKYGSLTLAEFDALLDILADEHAERGGR